MTDNKRTNSTNTAYAIYKFHKNAVERLSGMDTSQEEVKVMFETIIDLKNKFIKQFSFDDSDAIADIPSTPDSHLYIDYNVKYSSIEDTLKQEDWTRLGTELYKLENGIQELYKQSLKGDGMAKEMATILNNQLRLQTNLVDQLERLSKVGNPRNFSMILD